MVTVNSVSGAEVVVVIVEMVVGLRVVHYPRSQTSLIKKLFSL